MPTMLHAHIETTLGLNPTACKIVNAIANARFNSAMKCEETLLTVLPMWFVYRGSNHVALHLTAKGERLVIWKPLQ